MSAPTFYDHIGGEPTFRKLVDEFYAGVADDPVLRGKSIALVFFNTSLRTRTSFELGAFQLGGHAVVLQPGKDAWPIEFELGTVMEIGRAHV